MARPVRTSNLLKETAADHENLDRMADQERLAVNRAATQPPVQENESVIEKAEEKEPSVQEKLDAILPDDFFGEFEDLFNSEDVHIKEQIKQDMSPDILLKAPATVTDDGAAQAVSEAAEEKDEFDVEEIAQAVNENTAEKTGKEISVEAVEKAEEALRPEPAAAKTEKMPDLLPDTQTQEHKPTVTAGRKALVEPIPETREPEKVIRRMPAEEDLTPMHTINRAVRRTYKQIGLSQPVTNVSLQQQMISVYSPKGGVGKSTTAINLSSCLGEMGQKVLTIDMDPQGNTTSGMGVEKNEVENTIYELLLGESKLEDCIIPLKFDNLSLVPSNVNLAGAEIELIGVDDKEFILKKAIDQVRDQYDFIIIDCPPSLNMLTINAMTTADTVLVPIQCEYYALEGLSQLMHTIELVQERLNPDLEMEGVVFTMYDARTNLSLQVVENVKDILKQNIYKTIIPRNVRLAEAPSYGMPINYYDKRSTGAESYRLLADEVIHRGDEE